MKDVVEINVCAALDYLEGAKFSFSSLFDRVRNKQRQKQSSFNCAFNSTQLERLLEPNTEWIIHSFFILVPALAPVTAPINSTATESDHPDLDAIRFDPVPGGIERNRSRPTGCDPPPRGLPPGVIWDKSCAQQASCLLN
jgi:hypothetical protein